MTVTELIAMLKSEDPTACVVVRGYEDGYDDVDGLERITIAPNADTNEWDGAFELSAGGVENCARHTSWGFGVETPDVSILPI